MQNCLIYFILANGQTLCLQYAPQAQTAECFVYFYSSADEVSVLLGCSATSLDDWCLKLQTALSHIQGPKMFFLHGLLTFKDVTNMLSQNIRHE